MSIRRRFAVAVAEGARGGEVRELGNFLNHPHHIRKLIERLAKGGRPLSFCSEAGPCGYGLYRHLSALGHECTVVAPSLIPMKAGDRVKTDRRDAVMLARLHRAGELTAVWVPDDAHEAMRGLDPRALDRGAGLGQGATAFAGFSPPTWAHLCRQERLDPGLSSLADDGPIRRHAAQQLVLQDYIHAVTDAESLGSSA
jgi:transposase